MRFFRILRLMWLEWRLYRAQQRVYRAYRTQGFIIARDERDAIARKIDALRRKAGGEQWD